MLDKEFVPYQESLELKELGFNQYSCLGNYADDEKHTLFTNGNRPGKTNAPTFSQAFRWFRESYNLHAEPYTCDMGAIEYCFQIRDLYSEKYVYDNFRGAGGSYGGTFNTPEEAELACLRKLIEIVKNG